MSTESEAAPTIASLPPGTFWTRDDNLPPAECERELHKLINAEVPGIRWPMSWFRAMN